MIQLSMDTKEEVDWINWEDIKQFSESAKQQVPGDICFYCGSYSESRDHLVPRTFRGNKDDTPWVHSCKQCNSILGDRWEPNPWKRRIVVQKRLEEKSKNLMKGKWHTAEELDEYGYLLKRQLAGKIVKRWAWYYRISFPSKPPCYEDKEARESLEIALDILKIPPSEKFNISQDKKYL